MKRVAYYLVTSGFGGVESYLLTLLRHLNRSAWDPIVYFYCSDPVAEQRMRQELLSLNVPIASINEKGIPVERTSTHNGAFAPSADPTDQKNGCSKGLVARTLGPLIPGLVKAAWYYGAQVQRVSRHLRLQRLEVIHFLLGWYPWLEIPTLASRLAGIPVRLLDVHFQTRELRSLGVTRICLTWLAQRSASDIRAISPTLRAELISRCWAPRGKIRVIFNGVDVHQFPRVDRVSAREKLALAPHALVLGVIGRLSPEKGHRVLFEALSRLRLRHVPFRCLVIGDGPLREALEQRVRELSLVDDVSFLGFRRDIPQLLSACDVVVLPSLKEGVPITLLEAMAAARVVVATDVGGVKDIVLDNTTGRLVASGDVAQLAQALDELLRTDAETRAQIGAAAFERVQSSFSQQRMLESVFQLYQQPHGLHA